MNKERSTSASATAREDAAREAMRIIVCPLSRLHEIIELHRPDRVISMLDPESAFPNLGARYAGRHLQLAFHDVNVPGAEEVGPSAEHVRSVLHVVRTCDHQSTILIHCRAGISRSTATAYIVACAAHPDASEYAMAVRLREAAPLARPNETLVRLADAEMGRGGRMSAAIAETGRDLEWVTVQEGEPFVLQARV